MMRRLVIFVLRLWIDSEGSSASYEGRVEYIATGEYAHVHSEEDVVQFIRGHINLCQGEENPLSGDEDSSGASPHCSKNQIDSLK